MDWEGENIKIRFQPVPHWLIDINSCQMKAGPVPSTSPEIENQNLALHWTLVLQILTLNQR